mmetsp:Transcript_3953/g.5100  ORF Transcript_3953/g.5100 Transcript_3953/m.5100 type:complete len:591 (+) Transcript_3953:145-1917(+)
MRHVIATVVLLMSNANAGWIDTDTAEEHMTTKSLVDGSTYQLVMSDEFNVPNRNFADGSDPMWTALDKSDDDANAVGGGSLHFYNSSTVTTTEDGQLEIKSYMGKTEWDHYDVIKKKYRKIKKDFKSGMVQSWDKFCFTGGIIEAEVTLPGFSDIGGLWPAFWILGNLARHTYVGSSTHIWPWSTSTCNWQTEYAQLVSGCRNVDHFDMARGRGRGAPEIDIFEVQPGPYKAGDGPFWQMPVGQPFMSSSYQVAPGRSWNRPGDGWWPAPGQWYEGLYFGYNTSLNILFYGSYNHYRGDHDARKDYWSDAISFNRQLEQKHFQGKHVYRLQWGLPEVNGTDRGYLQWYVDGDLVLEINGTGLEASNTGSEISTEPSSILLNTAVSSQWGFPMTCPANCKCEVFDCHSPHYSETCGFSPGFCLMMSQITPAYKVNWVRVYQDHTNEQHKVGCSTPERPTKKFIEANAHLYMQEGDTQPLKKIQTGRGKCIPDSDTTGPSSCGGYKHGICTPMGVCSCNKGYTGPHCLAPVGFDPIPWDDSAKLGYAGPGLTPTAFLFIFGSLGVMMVMVAKQRHWVFNSYGFKPIPDVVIK